MMLELPLLTLISEHGISEVEKWDWELFQKMNAFKEFKNECEGIMLDFEDKGSGNKQEVEVLPLPPMKE